MAYNNFTLILMKTKNKNTYKLNIVKLSDKTYNLKKNKRVVDTIGTVSSNNKIFTFNINIFKLIRWVSRNIKISSAAMKKLSDYKIIPEHLILK